LIEILCGVESCHGFQPVPLRQLAEHPLHRMGEDLGLILFTLLSVVLSSTRPPVNLAFGGADYLTGSTK